MFDFCDVESVFSISRNDDFDIESMTGMERN